MGLEPKDIESAMIFGATPEGQLKDLANSYSIKEIYRSLLTLLALAVGSQVTYRGLAKKLSLDSKTVARYISVLEDKGVIFHLDSFSSPIKRREAVRGKKIYFCDTGIRNFFINNFNSINMRTDSDALWKNLVIVQRMKYRRSHHISVNQYFWQTYDGSQIDLVEERNGNLLGFKINQGLKNSAEPKKWADFKNSSYLVINRGNYKNYI